jgi:phospholipid/cholesterol/gamma-HCH transport system substrate-binding protein
LGHKRHLISAVAFAVVAACALAASIAYVGQFRLGPKLVYYADFAYASGLQAGAPIKVSGIKVGQIAALALLPASAQPKPALPGPMIGQKTPPVVRATLYVQQEVQPFVTAQSLWSVVTTGIIGDAYLELSPGAGAPCPQHTAMRGVDAPHLQHIALASQTILQHLAPLFEPVSDGQALPADAQACGGGVAGRLVQALARVLDAHADDFDSLFDEGAHALVDMRQLLGSLRQAVGNGESLKQTLFALSALTRDAQRDYPALQRQTLALVQHLGGLLERADAQMTPKQLQALLADASSALSHVAASAATADGMLEDIAQGQGTLGRALRDKTLYDDLQALLHDIREHPYKLLWRK